MTLASFTSSKHTNYGGVSTKLVLALVWSQCFSNFRNQINNN